MRCPACDNEIDWFKKTKFRITLIFKHVVTCPYCKATIYIKTNRTWEYYEEFLFVFFGVGFILLLLAIIFGRHIGFKSALTTCFYFWLIVAAVFFTIFSLNLIYVFSKRLLKMSKNNKNQL